MAEVVPEPLIASLAESVDELIDILPVALKIVKALLQADEANLPMLKLRESKLPLNPCPTLNLLVASFDINCIELA